MNSPTEVTVWFVDKDDARTRITHEGETTYVGIAIPELRRQLGGDQGIVRDAFGGEHHVTIPSEIDEESTVAVVQHKYKVKPGTQRPFKPSPPT